MYVPSGTMANQVAVRTHTEPGDEILVEAEAHLYYYEAGAPAALSGVMCRLLRGEHGIFTATQVQDALRSVNVHYPRTRLLCVENTHNRGGGSVWPLARVAEVAAVAHAAGLQTHLDGARLWNAAVATGIAEAEYARHFDSVCVCFSKGLGAPVGSALAGCAAFIDRARRFRKQFGGAMRQAGIVAAGALYALQHHRERLAEDHANARRLAEHLAGLPGLRVDPAAVETNMVFFDVTTMPAEEFRNRLQAAGVLVLATGPRTLRAVTSLEVSARDVDRAVGSIRRTLEQTK
jgi:threonine aldolase